MYEGVARTLEKLSHRYKLFIVTNAQRGYIDTVFAVHDVRKYFSDWMCFGDTNASKDVTIRKIIERNNLKNAVYVGDTQGDADSCEKAGIPIVYAAYGLGRVEKPWRSIDKFSELEDIFLEKKPAMRHRKVYQNVSCLKKMVTGKAACMQMYQRTLH